MPLNEIYSSVTIKLAKCTVKRMLQYYLQTLEVEQIDHLDTTWPSGDHTPWPNVLEAEKSMVTRLITRQLPCYLESD